VNIRSIKRSFLAAFPVVGPHTNIEAELMLAGKKPLTWTFVAPDDMTFKDLSMQKDHQGRKLLDCAVAERKLIAVDIEQRDPDHPEYVVVFRHYAQPGQEENLKRVSEFNRRAFNRLDLSEVSLDQDMGHYLGYQRRDILFFNHIVHSGFLPDFIIGKIIDFNSSCQRARREKLLLEAGYDLQAWRDSLPQPQHDQ
jgi:hypothetical protein